MSDKDEALVKGGAIEEMRAKIRSLIHAKPGLFLSEVVEESNASWASVYRRVKELEANGAIEARTLRGRLFLFPKGVSEEEEQVAWASWILRAKPARDIALAIVEAPGAHNAATLIKRYEGVYTTRIVMHRLQQLRAEGLLHSSSEARYTDLSPTDLLKVTLGHWRGTR